MLSEGTSQLLYKPGCYLREHLSFYISLDVIWGGGGGGEATIGLVVI